METGRPSNNKKIMNISDVEDDLVSMIVRVPREVRTKIKQMALDQERTAQDILFEFIAEGMAK